MMRELIEPVLLGMIMLGYATIIAWFIVSTIIDSIRATRRRKELQAEIDRINDKWANR